MKSRKAVGWSIDFMVALLIFLIAGILAFKILSNTANSDFGDVRITARAVASDLMSEGFPFNWDNETAIRIGLMNGRRLDLNKFKEFTELDYDYARQLLNSRYDFYIYFENVSGVRQFNFSLGNPICGYGHPLVKTENSSCNPILDDIDYSNLVHVNRIVIIDSSIFQLRALVWE